MQHGMNDVERLMYHHPASAAGEPGGATPTVA